MTIDEENLGVDFHDHELDNPDLFNDEESRMNSESTAFLTSEPQSPPNQRQKDAGKGIHYTRSPRFVEDDGDDDDVPMSLLIESDRHSKTPRRNKPAETYRSSNKPLPVPGPSNRETRARWESAQAQQPLHPDEGSRAAENLVPTLARPGNRSVSAAERAMWTWVNTDNLDAFVQDVYDYYTGSGMWCILLERLLRLLRMVFVAVFITFLVQCVDFSQIQHRDRLEDIMVPKCTQKISGIWNVFIWLFAAFAIFDIYSTLAAIPGLVRMRDFYQYCLHVPDVDMQTVSWPVVVNRFMDLRDENVRTTTQKLSPAQQKYLGTQSKARLNPEDIANRLMRKENYLVALFNKEILDFTVPIPFLRDTQLYSQILEWSLSFGILDLIFDERGQVQPKVLKDSNRREMSNDLKIRFIFAGIMFILCTPVIFAYMVIVYFFQYFNEYQKNPSAIGARKYTPFAQWKFREFNEVRHLFEERLTMSYPYANDYIEQFPKRKTTQVAKFTAFVAGAIIAVLGLSTLLDPEMFLGFQITKDRTVLFYLGIFGAIWAVAKGSIPDENEVFDPAIYLRAVINYTHYSPPHWADRLHTDEVKKEFSTLYQMRIVIFAMELVGIIFTPLILLITLPKCSDRIIDFFREFTVHIDGLGYVCSFGRFDFENGVGRAEKRFKDNTADGDNLRDEYFSTQHGKMEASFLNFNHQYHPHTGAHGRGPTSRRHTQFFPPPSFPGLMSASLNRRTSRGMATGSRTPRFPAVANPSPMTSMMLDQHNPSTSGRDVKRNSRSQYKSTRNIRQETIDDEEEDENQDSAMRGTNAFGGSGLDESRWETSPARKSSTAVAEAVAPDGQKDPPAPGVLGLLYQFQKAHTEGMKGPAGVSF